jgi:hypothetical protein
MSVEKFGYRDYSLSALSLVDVDKPLPKSGTLLGQATVKTAGNGGSISYGSSGELGSVAARGAVGTQFSSSFVDETLSFKGSGKLSLSDDTLFKNGFAQTNRAFDSWLANVQGAEAVSGIDTGAKFKAGSDKFSYSVNRAGDASVKLADTDDATEVRIAKDGSIAIRQANGQTIVLTKNNAGQMVIVKQDAQGGKEVAKLRDGQTSLNVATGLGRETASINVTVANGRIAAVEVGDDSRTFGANVGASGTPTYFAANRGTSPSWNATQYDFTQAGDVALRRGAVDNGTEKYPTTRSAVTTNDGRRVASIG